ncbi:MAG: SseB family protein [Pseudomonadota bacterium]
MTPLDQAYADMEAGGDAERLAYYGRLSQVELFLALTEEPSGDRIKPWVFDTGQGKFAIAFDTEERLSEFGNGPTAFVALSGRAVMDMLRGQNIGLGVNLVVAPSGHLMEPKDVEWLANVLDQRPEKTDARPVSLHPPATLPDSLLVSLDARLSALDGQARYAYLVEAEYEANHRNHVLAFVNALEGAEDALAQTVSEALSFSGIEAGALDVMFIAASDPIAAQFAKAGLRFDLPEAQVFEDIEFEAPGSDPSKPPILH